MTCTTAQISPAVYLGCFFSGNFQKKEESPLRRSIKLMTNWQFTKPGCEPVVLNLPHTWNNIDGQDGGNDYWRGRCRYQKTFLCPAFDPASQQVWLQFEGVNASATVVLNDTVVCSHDGGYSTFRADITALLEEENTLTVEVDNAVNDRVYPQKADFTFYGGIYRDVTLLVVNKNHFALAYYGTPGIKVTATPKDGKATIEVETWTNCEGEIAVSILDAEDNTVLSGAGKDCNLVLNHPHLWDGVKDPYLYTAVATLSVDGQPVDEVRTRFGVRSFCVDPRKGFFLNGRSYPLHGASRHQDRKGLGNAITREMHEEDMALMKEMGCNTIRLAHYQHDQYFYDLCDENGMVVWAEIPYISEHMPNGRENTISQMKELIIQNYNHASIVCWGISNEITISTKDKKDMLDNHRVLNDLCHTLDKTRFTTLACYAMCGPFNKVAHITDVVSWNLYLGWYVPGPFLNDLWCKVFHLFYPNRALGYSEYGAEAMPNLHSDQPKRNDHSEEYQCLYHEFMLKFFQRDGRMWATHVWNMFDFAADARDQGGEPGMNHKGLVTFDRKIKKDSFYLYKAWWSEEPFVHLCGKRYEDRTGPVTAVKVYSNQPKVALYVDGKLLGEKTGEKEFLFTVPMKPEQACHIQAVAGNLTDEMTIRNVVQPNIAYKLKKDKNRQKSNWV